MSLSGLDIPAVDAAEKKVLQERGAWFLLYYTSRDCIEVLAQGAKGLAEMRDAAENYYNGTQTASSPAAPLYGMIDFRRRKVLIKLILEGTSRLVQARVQVHWNSVTSRFPNHETIFEAASLDELNETGFLAHIELHSGRSSAGSMSKRLHLSGISEEQLEDLRASSDQKTGCVESPLVKKMEETRSSDLLAPTVQPSHPDRISNLVTAAAATSAALQESLASSSQAKAAPDISVVAEESLDQANGDSQSMYSIASADAPLPGADAADRRFSLQSGRPSISEGYNYDVLYKPKVKLGPRPTADHRSPAAKGHAVATLPAGLRSSRVGLSSSRPSSRDSTTRPKSRDSARSAYKVPPPPPIPESSSYSFAPRPSSSGNSVKSLPATLPKSPGMSREKQRLMKFRAMYREKETQRSRQKTPVAYAGAQKAKAATDDAFADEADNEVEERTDLDPPDENDEQPLSNPPSVLDSSVGSLPASGLASPRQTTPLTPTDEFPRTLSASSGIGNSSSPVSAVDSSARAASTRPSSVSDSSDIDKTSSKETSRSAPSLHIRGAATEVTTPRNIAQEGAFDDEDNHSTTTSSTTPTGISSIAKTDEKSQVSSPRRVVSSSSTLSSSERRQMRRALVSPIIVPAATANADLSDAHLSDSDADVSYDEDFMDELHDAVVVEAKSMLVSKSPIMPFFSKRPIAQMTDSTTPMSTPLTRTFSPLPSPTIINLDRTPSDSLARGPGRSPLIGTSATSVSEVISPPVLPLEPISQSTSAEAPKAVQNEKSNGNEKSAERENNVEEVKKLEDVKTVKTVKDQKTFIVGGSEAEPGARDEEERENVLRPSISSLSNSSTILNGTERTPSFTLLTPSAFPASPLPRSPAGSFLSSIPKQKDDLVSKKGRLGSGVASKIADLQRSFTRPSSPSDPAPLPLTSTRSYSNSRRPLISQRAGSFVDSQPTTLTPPRSSSSQLSPSFSSRDAWSARGRAMSKGSIMSIDSRESKTSASARNHSSGSVEPGRLNNRNIPPPMSQAEVSGRDVIQVKATIIRTTDGPEVKAEPSAFMESPLVVTQQRGTSATPASTMPPPALPASRSQSPTKEKRHSRQRSSLSAALRGFSSTSTVTLSETISSQGLDENENGKRKSMDLGSSLRMMSRRASLQLSRSTSTAKSPTLELPSPPFSRSSSARGGDRKSIVSANGDRPILDRSMSISSMDSITTNESQQNGNDAKGKGNRASRLMKRMSNGMSSIASVTRAQLGTLNEVENGKRASFIEENEENQPGAGWKAMEIGDLNVQFPDTLLWKQRRIAIDADGFLILRPVQQTYSNPASATIMDRRLERKYHISQFYSPFAPDMERMEMPFSVVLDFKEDAEVDLGGCLQVAAQSGKGQRAALDALANAHRVWMS